MKCQGASRAFFFIFFIVFIVYLHFINFFDNFSAIVNIFDKKYGVILVLSTFMTLYL